MISIFPEMARSPSDVVGLGYPIIDKWCTKAVLSATLNGSYTAEFTIPHKAKGVKRELLPDVKQVIKLIDMDGDEEYFRVRRFKHNLKETVITAEHISYDLIDNLIEDINNVDKDGQGIMDKISAGTQYKHPFRLTSDILKTANIRMVRMNPIQALIGTADNTFVNRLGGELKRKQFTLAMNESIGTHRTDVIRSRRNLTGFEREINLEDYATRIMPRAKNGIELPEKYVDSPHIAPDHPVIKVIDYSDVEYDGEFKDLSDSDKNRVYNELRACAKADFAAGRDVPNASYEVDFITLRNTVEYADYRALENYNLGDTVSIYEADYDVEIEAKVISFEWDVLNKRYTSMKLGSFKNGIVRSNFNKTNSVDAKISQAQSTADIALLSADGKTTNFYGTGEPVNPKKGDTWFKKNGSEEEVWQYQEVDGVMMWVYVTGTRYANALKESIAHDFSEVTQQITEQQQAHDRTVAEILAQVDSTQSLAEQAKAIGDQAKADAVNLASQLSTAKTALQNSINDTKSQIATVSQALSTAKSDLQTQVNAADAKAEQAQTDVDGLKTKAETIKNDLNTAKSELQTQVNAADAKAEQAQRDITQAKSDLQNQASQLITQAAKQVELTKLTTETKQLADGTLTSLNELSKTVDKNTGNITSVANRTKTVEDNLAGVKTNYTQLNQTVNAQTGQIDSINRKTADLQSGIDGVNNRFETIWASENNLLSNTETLSTYSPLAFPTNNYLGRAIKRITKSANSSVLAEGLVMQTNETLVNPKEMILSFHVKANRDARIRCFMYNPNANKDVATSDGYTAKSSADGMAVLNVTTSWQRVWIKWTYLVNYLAKPRIIIGRILETYDTDVSVDISAPALYHGHHNKEWSPAGLDFKNELATYVQSAQESSAELSRRIETADGKAVEAKTYAQQTATQLSNRLTSLETYKNAEGTRAQAYFEAAKTETAKQITAERSVIARDYTAKSTYQEDVTSIRRTISETKTELSSVTNRTKVVEDDLSGTKTKLEQVKVTADSTSRKTAELQNGIDGVTERFDALRTGGKNLILNSAYPTNLEHWSGNMVIANHGFYYNGQKSLFKLQTSSTSEITASTNRFDVKRNTDYTISFYAFASGNVSSADVWFLGRKAGEANDFTSTNMFIGARRLSPVKAEYVTVTFNSGDNDTGYIRFDNNGSTDGNASYLLFGEIMLVEGTIPQTHQFADEDLSNKIAEYKRTADQNYAGLQSTISALDGKITQNKSEQVQTAEVFRTKLTSLESYKDAEGSRAQAYFEASKTETAKQITAERIAISQNYVAKSTYQEDAAGVTRRLTATETVANRADTTANSAVTKATNAQSIADTAKANVTTVTTRLATYQETNDRRVAALETAKSSTDGTLTQLSNKVEQNAQQTRETISAVEAKIPTDFGGDNLILEGDRQEAGKYWNNTDLFTHSFYYSGQKKLFRLQTSSASEITTSSNRFLVKRNTKYSLSFWTFSASNVSSFDVWFLGRKAGETNDFTSPNLLVGAHKNSPGSAEYVTATFNSGNNDEGYIRFDNNGSSDGNNALFAFGEVMLVEGTIPKHFSKNVAEVITEISNAKLDITKTAEGLKLAATKTELTNAQNNLQSGINAAKSAAESAQAKANSNASTITQHATQITALNNELSAKVSKTDYNTLTGRVTNAESQIQIQAGEISKRLTSTQVESAITAKGYQTKAQVDSNIAGRGYITSSALQPYATTTVLENKVRETVDSFNRTISSVRLEIPTNASMRNLILKSSDKWGSYTSTNNANSNWCPEICRITLDSDRGISVGKKLNLFVYISANNVTLDSSSSHIIAIQAAIIKKDGTNLWHADVPFHGQWSQNLKAGNNYYVIKLTKEIKATAYENGATLIVQCRIDGANHVDFHHRAAMITTGDMFPDTWYPAPEDMATVVAFNKVSDTVDHHTQTLKDQEGRINTVLQTATTAYQLLQDGGRIYEDLKTVKGQIQQVRDANYATRIETLAGSWAVKNLTSGGQMLNQFNLLANGINHIDGRLTHITGDTLIDRGVIKSAMIGNGQIGTAHIGTIDASQANIINLNVNKLVGFDATFIKGKFDNVIADLLKGKTVAAQNGAMTIDLLGGAITMRNEGKFIVEGSYAEFTRQEGLIKTSLAFHDYNNDRNGITLSVNDGLGKSTSLKAIWFNERECYITGFDKIMLRTSNGNGIHITKEALEFSIDGSSYILGKTTFDKIARL